MCRAIAEFPQVAEVVGIDPSPEFVGLAEQHAADIDKVTFEVGVGTDLAFSDESFDVVVMHTLLTHVAEQDRVLAEAHRVLRADGWLAIFDADFTTESVAICADDPLEVCMDARRVFFVHDPFSVRRMPAAVAAAGFEPGTMASYGQIDTTNEVGTTGWVDMAAAAMAANGRISEEMAAAYSAEAQRRLEAGTWFSYLSFASLIARPAR